MNRCYIKSGPSPQWQDKALEPIPERNDIDLLMRKAEWAGSAAAALYLQGVSLDKSLCEQIRKALLKQWEEI